jgi:hypothetical protein
MMCHGAGAGAAGYAPDLRASPLMLSVEAMKDIVIGGSRRSMGMPNFKEFVPMIWSPSSISCATGEYAGAVQSLQTLSHTSPPIGCCGCAGRQRHNCLQGRNILGNQEVPSHENCRFPLDALSRFAGRLREEVQVGVVHLPFSEVADSNKAAQYYNWTLDELIFCANRASTACAPTNTTRMPMASWSTPT